MTERQMEPQKKTINERMREKIERRPECRVWSARQWADCLDCADSTVVATAAWKELMDQRAKIMTDRDD